MLNPEEVLKDFRQLLEETPQRIHASGLKDIYFMEKMGMKRNTYYRKKKEPHLFTMDELKMLYSIIGSQK